MHGDAAIFQHSDHGLTGQAVQDGVGQGCVNLTVFDKEDVGAGRFGNIAAVIHEQRVRAAFGLGCVLGHGADHVQTSGLGRGRDGFRAGPFPFGHVKFGTLVFGVAVIAAPFPRGHGHADLVTRGGNAHVLACAAPCHHADIGISEAVGVQYGLLGGFDLVHGVGDRHIHHFARTQ